MEFKKSFERTKSEGTWNKNFDGKPQFCKKTLSKEDFSKGFGVQKVGVSPLAGGLLLDFCDRVQGAHFRKGKKKK